MLSLRCKLWFRRHVRYLANTLRCHGANISPLAAPES
jgi:hypothetical protein